MRDVNKELLDTQFKLAWEIQEKYRLQEICRAQRRLLLQWAERYKDAAELLEETEFITR